MLTVLVVRSRGPVLDHGPGLVATLQTIGIDVDPSAAGMRGAHRTSTRSQKPAPTGDDDSNRGGVSIRLRLSRAAPVDCAPATDARARPLRRVAGGGQRRR